MAQHSAERLFQPVAGKYFRSWSMGQHRALDQHGAVAEFGDRPQIMRRDQNDLALVAQCPQQRDDRILGLDVDAGKRLVEQDYLTLLRQGTGEEHALLLPARELPDLPLGEIAHIDARQRCRDLFPVDGARHAKKVHVAEAAHHHHILDQHREIPVDLLGLRHIGDLVLPLCLSAVLPENGNFTRGQGHEAHDRLENCGLSGAVDTHQRGDRATWRSEAGMAQRYRAIAIGDGNVGDSDAGSVGHCVNPATIVLVVTRNRSR